jgi:hypothetical protein
LKERLYLILFFSSPLSTGMAVESKSRLNSRVLSPLMDKRKTHHHRLLVISFRASFAAGLFLISWKSM